MIPERGAPMPEPGRPIAPMQMVQQIRWLSDLTDEEIDEAIRSASTRDLGGHWPELSRGELAELWEQARWMSRSRLRAWREGRERQPTWLEVRALLSGLHDVLR